MDGHHFQIVAQFLEPSPFFIMFLLCSKALEKNRSCVLRLCQVPQVLLDHCAVTHLPSQRALWMYVAPPCCIHAFPFCADRERPFFA